MKPFFFSHDSNASSDPKIIQMCSVYSAQGYGWYWMIVEMMREQKDYKLLISGKSAVNALAKRMYCDRNSTRKFASWLAMRLHCGRNMIKIFASWLEDCINVFHLFRRDGDYVWSESLVKRMKQMESKSENARQSAMARWAKDADSIDSHSEIKTENANAMRSQCERTENKTKQNKTKQINNNNNKTLSSEPPKTTDSDPCPYDAILKLFNETCKSLPKVKVLSNSRKDKLRRRWKDIGSIDGFLGLFTVTEETAFLRGENKNGWTATFDWLIENDRNYAKVLEGNYNSQQVNWEDM